MKIELTAAAQERFKGLLAKDAKTKALRLSLRKSGCNGFAYHLELAQDAQQDEIQTESGGVPILANKADEPRLNGMVIDWRKEGLSSRVVFENPNAKSECGCGESVAF